MNKIYICQNLFLTSVLILISGCGVKGRPLPPLDPPYIGRGEPNYSEATKDINIKKKKNIKIKDDFEDLKDFPEEKK